MNFWVVNTTFECNSVSFRFIATTSMITIYKICKTFSVLYSWSLELNLAYGNAVVSEFAIQPSL